MRKRTVTQSIAIFAERIVKLNVLELFIFAVVFFFLGACLSASLYKSAVDALIRVNGC